MRKRDRSWSQKVSKQTSSSRHNSCSKLEGVPGQHAPMLVAAPLQLPPDLHAADAPAHESIRHSAREQRTSDHKQACLTRGIQLIGRKEKANGPCAQCRCAFAAATACATPGHTQPEHAERGVSARTQLTTLKSWKVRGSCRQKRACRAQRLGHATTRRRHSAPQSQHATHEQSSKTAWIAAKWGAQARGSAFIPSVCRAG